MVGGRAFGAGGVLYGGPMRVLLIVLVLALVLYSLLDCARTPEDDMPARMPKFLWIALIILFPAVGSIAWIIVSRVKAAEERGGYVEPTVWSSKEGTRLRRPEKPRALGPDDDPEFLRDLEQGLRRRRHREDPQGGEWGRGSATSARGGADGGTEGPASSASPGGSAGDSPGSTTGGSGGGSAGVSGTPGGNGEPSRDEDEPGGGDPGTRLP